MMDISFDFLENDYNELLDILNFVSSTLLIFSKNTIDLCEIKNSDLSILSTLVDSVVYELNKILPIKKDSN